MYQYIIDLVGINPNDDLIGFIVTSLLLIYFIFMIFQFLYTVFNK